MNDGETYFTFMKNTRIEESGASCHTTNDDRSVYNIIIINESVQGSSGSMSVTKGENCI